MVFKGTYPVRTIADSSSGTFNYLECDDSCNYDNDIADILLTVSMSDHIWINKEQN